MSLLAEMRFAFNTARRAACLACLGVALPLAAQEPLAANGDFLLRNWEVDDGLPGNTVTAVIQTRDGYLWVGTSRGLARFDGVRFRPFTAANTPALASGHVRFLTEDANGALWIGLARGGIVRCRDGTFERIAPQTDTSTDWPTSLVADARGGVWAGLPDLRAKCWRDGRWTQFNGTNGLAGRGGVNCLADSSRRIWFTTETSYGFFDGECFAALAADVPLPQVMPCRKGGYWLARASVLGRFDQRGETLLMGQPPWRGGAAEIQTLLEDRSGALWIGTKGQGLYRLDDEGLERVPSSHDFITALREDREGNLWAGTLGGGLDRLRPRPIRIHNKSSGLPADAVNALCQDGDGAMWFASHTAGAVRFAGGRYTLFTVTNGWPGGIVTTLCADRDAGVWFGTLGEGLVHWRNGSFNNKGLKGEHIESLFQDSHNTLWVATRRAGLIQWRDGNLSRISTNDVPPEITALSEDSAGHLWAGTQTGALHRFDGARWQRFGREIGLPAAAIQAIHCDGPGTLWFGTHSAGLVRLKKGKASLITTRNGLLDDDLHQILSDGDNLWFGSAHGLFRAACSDLAAVADGKRPTVDCVSYGRSDGLGSVEFVEGDASASCRAHDGRLWFASRRGAVEVNPALLLARLEPPPVHIEEVRVDGESLPAVGPFVVPSGSHVVEFRYTAPGFSAPEKIRFRHRVENGRGVAWVEAGTDRAATFLNLPPGGYRFRVTACDAEGRWNETGAALEFAVQPAFWQTTWFRVAVLVVLLVHVAAAVRITMRRRLRALERQHALDEERARIAKDMHDHLGANLTRIALLSEQARGDAAASSEAAARATKIARAARDVSQTLDEIVWAMNPGNDTLERLIGYLSEYATEYLAPTQIKLEQDLPAAVSNAPIPSRARHNLFLAFKEALHNAVKHAAATQITLRVTVEPGLLRVTLADNGRGFEPGAPRAAGHGLANMRQRLLAAGGDCRIECAPGKGAQIIFTLPLALRPT
ncbi:MAG: hypothetical protein HZA91_19980 [Verrucomicrobia bacterium]|nr:hypothetical protein [Verrucomicrobiota bacterium]